MCNLRVFLWELGYRHVPAIPRSQRLLARFSILRSRARGRSLTSIPSHFSGCTLSSGYMSQSTGFFGRRRVRRCGGSGTGSPSLRRANKTMRRAQSPRPMKTTKSARKATRKLKGTLLRALRSGGAESTPVSLGVLVGDTAVSVLLSVCSAIVARWRGTRCAARRGRGLESRGQGGLGPWRGRALRA